VNQAGIAQRWRAGVAALLRARSPQPRLSRLAWTADAVLAVVMAASTLNYAAKASGHDSVIKPARPGFPGSVVVPSFQHAAVFGPWQVILALLTGLPLAARRRYPLATFWAVIVATLLLHIGVRDTDTAVFTFAACLIAAYSAAMYSPYRARTVLSLVVGAGLIAARHDTTVPDITAGYLPFLVLLALGLMANSIHTWKQRVSALQVEQHEATRQAVQRERARIARELHDVVTHNVAVMVVQAGAARKVIDAAPDQARQALLAVEAGGRAAMAELRHVMGLLTMTGGGPDPAATADLAPQPGLDQIATLAGRVRDTGVPVELTMTGTRTPLPPGIDLAAYRVVQEALTNTVKHAAGARVRISVDYTPDTVRVEVVDTGGTTTAAVDPGNGRGLVGLKERLAVYGGTLQAGARPTGGYRVRATIPVEQP
jgi:signal transduction histidine kinase